MAISKDNKTVKKEGKSYKDFNQLVSDSTLSWVNCCVDDLEKKISEISQNFGFGKELAQDLLSHRTYAYVDVGSELGLLLPAIKVRGLRVNVSRVFLLIKKNLILSLQSRRVTRFMGFFDYAEIFIKKIPANVPQEDKITMILLRLLSKNDEKNFDNLRLIEEQGDGISALLADASTPRTMLGAEIYKMKHALISYLGALWASVDVVNSLRYGDSKLITDNPALLGEFAILASDLTNHISISEHTSEVLASGLEVLQSIYNNQLQILNNRLSLLVTWLTVLGTAVLVPNTLATIFGIPSVSEHIDWHSAIWLLVICTIASAVLAYVLTKRMIPKKVD